MRSLVLPILLLIAIGGWFCRTTPGSPDGSTNLGTPLQPVATQSDLAVDPKSATEATANWRRTANGWELASDRYPDRPNAPTIWTPRTAIHPGLVALFLLLVSLGALQLREVLHDPSSRRPYQGPGPLAV